MPILILFIIFLFAAVVYFLIRRKQIRCYLCGQKIMDRSNVNSIDGKRRVICGNCDDVNQKFRQEKKVGN